MVDKVERFMLSLKGYPYKGHMDYWSFDQDCLGWITEKKYSLITAPWMNPSKISFIEKRIILMNAGHFTLGKEVDFLTLMEIIENIEKGKYYDPNFTTYKLPGWPD